MSIFCVIAVTYVTLDLLASAYIVQRRGGIRATLDDIRTQFAVRQEATDGSEYLEDDED